jgi:regulator of sigma E protease
MGTRRGQEVPVLTIVVGALSLGLFILVHEVGHFLMARRMGVRVLKFSIGFGPRVVGFSRGDTEFVVSAVPLGGFVKMAGDEEPTGDPRELRSRPWWARSLVAFGGPAANVVLGFVLFTITAMVGIQISDGPSLVGAVDQGSDAAQLGLAPGDRIISVGGREVGSWFEISEAWRDAADEPGDDVRVGVARGDTVIEMRVWPDRDETWLSGVTGGFPPVVGEVEMGMPAYAAGLQRGDTVLTIDGRGITSYDEMREIVLANPGSTLVFALKRGSQVRDVPVIPVSREVLGVGTGGLIGILPMEASTRVVRLGPVDALYHGAASTFGMLGATYVGLYRIARHPIMFREHLSGPIAIAQMSAAQARKGVGSLVHFVAFISIALAVMNLLPIPILDGGQILFCLTEAVRGRPLKIRSEMVLQRIGVVLLVGLMCLALINDTRRAIARSRAVGRATEQAEPQAGGP